jgi:hypothetical protein
VNSREQVATLQATLSDQRATIADLERRLYDVQAAREVTRNALRVAEFEVWLDDDRASFPIPPHGKEEMFQQGAWRERRVWWVESRTEKGSIRLALEIRRPNRTPERRFTHTLRVGTADYLAACAEYGLTP